MELSLEVHLMQRFSVADHVTGQIWFPGVVDRGLPHVTFIPREQQELRLSQLSKMCFPGYLRSCRDTLSIYFLIYFLFWLEVV